MAHNHDTNRFDVVRAFAFESLNRNLSTNYILNQIQYASRAIRIIQSEIWNIQQSDSTKYHLHLINWAIIINVQVLFGHGVKTIALYLRI